MSDEEREEKELDLSSPEVVTKYKNAAEIANSYYLSLSELFLCMDLYLFCVDVCSLQVPSVRK